MPDIKELATLTAAEMDDVYLRNVPAIVLEQYCTRFLAAYLKGQEPACYIVQEESPDGVEYGYSASYPEAVHEHINDTIQRLVDNDLAPPVMHCVPLFTAPPLPAGEIVVTTDETGRCVAVTRQDDEGRILGVIWEADPVIQHTANDDGWCDWVSPKMKGYQLVCCDCGLVHEVEFMVVKFDSDGPKTGDCAYEIITDINVQVMFRMKRASPLPAIPDGMVMVPREPTEEMVDAVIDERLNALMDSRPHTLVDIYKAMIAAGEVKP